MKFRMKTLWPCRISGTPAERQSRKASLMPLNIPKKNWDLFQMRRLLRETVQVRLRHLHHHHQYSNDVQAFSVSTALVQYLRELLRRQ